MDAADAIIRDASAATRRSFELVRPGSLAAETREALKTIDGK
jgi:hypothetical protein